MSVLTRCFCNWGLSRRCCRGLFILFHILERQLDYVYLFSAVDVIFLGDTCLELLLQPVPELINSPFLNHLSANVRLVAGLSIPIRTFYLSAIEVSPVHDLNALLSGCLFLELHLDNSLRMRLEVANSLNLTDSLALRLDILLGFVEQLLIA